MLPFRFPQFPHESEGKKKHSFTLLRQWLTRANILIKLQWMRLQHGLCNYASVLCATPGTVNLSNSPQAQGCGCHRRLLRALEMGNWFAFSSRPIESVREQPVLIWLGFPPGEWRNCSYAIHRSESWSWSRISCYWTRGTVLDAPHTQQ